MKRIDVVKSDKGWVGKSGDKIVSKAETKAEVVRKTANVAKSSSEPVTVKIHKVDGKIQEERTYPGSADPKGSKG